TESGSLVSASAFSCRHASSSPPLQPFSIGVAALAGSLGTPSPSPPFDATRAASKHSSLFGQGGLVGGDSAATGGVSTGGAFATGSGGALHAPRSGRRARDTRGFEGLIGVHDTPSAWPGARPSGRRYGELFFVTRRWPSRCDRYP